MALPAAADFTGATITEAQFKTAITDLRNYIADLQTLPVGTLIYVKKTSAPGGFIKANGAAVLRSSYSALDAAIYCGDANNATADSCYRCTDSGNPTNTRSTTGAYIVLPDERGEFPRGWDDARGVDMSRSLWAHQVDQNKSHSHTGSAASNGAHTHSVYFKSGGGSVVVIEDTAKTTGSAGLSIATTSSAGSHTHTLTTNSSGGTEARVRNNAWLACIKY